MKLSTNPSPISHHKTFMEVKTGHSLLIEMPKVEAEAMGKAKESRSDLQALLNVKISRRKFSVLLVMLVQKSPRASVGKSTIDRSPRTQLPSKMALKGKGEAEAYHCLLRILERVRRCMSNWK